MKTGSVPLYHASRLIGLKSERIKNKANDSKEAAIGTDG